MDFMFLWQLVMFGNFAKLDSPRRLVQFWQNFQTSLVLLIPNCTRQRMITYTNVSLNLVYKIRPIIIWTRVFYWQLKHP